MRQLLRVAREARLPAAVQAALSARRAPRHCAAPAGWAGAQQRSPWKRRRRSLAARLGGRFSGVAFTVAKHAVLFLLLLLCFVDSTHAMNSDETSTLAMSPTRALLLLLLL